MSLLKQWEAKQRAAGKDPNDFAAWIASDEYKRLRAICDAPLPSKQRAVTPPAHQPEKDELAGLPVRYVPVKRSGQIVLEPTIDAAAIVADSLSKLRTRTAPAGLDSDDPRYRMACHASIVRRG